VAFVGQTKTGVPQMMPGFGLSLIASEPSKISFCLIGRWSPSPLLTRDFVLTLLTNFCGIIGMLALSRTFGTPTGNENGPGMS
jgi:hypothetical protein